MTARTQGWPRWALQGGLAGAAALSAWFSHGWIAGVNAHIAATEPTKAQVFSDIGEIRRDNLEIHKEQGEILEVLKEHTKLLQSIRDTLLSKQILSPGDLQHSERVTNPDSHPVGYWWRVRDILNRQALGLDVSVEVEEALDHSLRWAWAEETLHPALPGGRSPGNQAADPSTVAAGSWDSGLPGGP